jgi:hypothetical protein
MKIILIVIVTAQVHLTKVGTNYPMGWTPTNPVHLPPHAVHNPTNETKFCFWAIDPVSFGDIARLLIT